MKTITMLSLIAFLLILGSYTAAAQDEKTAWTGVDESVVEKYAQEAGRPSWKPLINTDQGDLLLFVFLLAGTCGGFVAGYHFRALFSKKESIPKA